MMKRGLALIFILVLLSNFALAQPALPLENDLGNVQNGTDQVRDFVDQKKWEYLSEEWQEILLGNEIIASIDKGLSNVNNYKIFFFIFGQDYTLSLTFLFVVILWVFFFMIFGRVIADFSTFSESVSYLISLIFVLILAHLRVWAGFAEFMFGIIFYQEGAWTWASTIIFILAYLFILIFLKQIIWKVGRAFKKSQEEKAEWDRKFNMDLIMKKAEGFERTIDEINSELAK